MSTQSRMAAEQNILPDRQDAAGGQPRAARHTLGCRLDQAETEAIRSNLEAAGYRIVPWGEEAEVFVLNSCTVTAHSDAKSRQALGAMRRRYPEAKLALVGCYAQTDGARLAEWGVADLIVGNGAKLRVADFLSGLERGARPQVVRPRVVRPPLGRRPFRMEAFALPADTTRAALKVQDGCDFMCTFCIIPTSRGRARPRELADLLAEAEALAAAGTKELVLTGVNIGTATFATATFAGETLTEVVDRLDRIPGLARIRISSIEPTTVPEGLLERMADSAHRLVPFLHLPLQSGSDRVLRAMRRRYAAADYRRFAEEALAAVPDLCLGADVMVGFPGEEEADFEATREPVAALPFAYLHVFPFSERRGTTAARMAGKVPPAVRQRRAALLREVSEAGRRAFYGRFRGEVRDVLFETPRSPAVARGLTDHYIRVEVPAPGPFSTARAAALRNRILPVKLLGVTGPVMQGELAEPGDAKPGGSLLGGGKTATQSGK